MSWIVFFFFMQKTAYEMRISDWSSDVCSSDLGRWRDHGRDHVPRQRRDEGLPEEPEGDAGGLCRRLVPFRRPRGAASGRLHADQGPLERHHHLGRREYLDARGRGRAVHASRHPRSRRGGAARRSEEHTSELVTNAHLVCRLLLEKKKKVSET